MPDIPEQTITVAKGSDWVRFVRVYDKARIILSADAAAGATTLTLAPDHPAIASGDKILFGENVILTTSGSCAAGATSLGVTAIPGPLKARAIGQRIVKDLSAYAIEFRVFAHRGASETLFTLAEASGVTVGDDTTDPAGSGKSDVVQVDGDEDNTADLDAGAYFWVLWRVDEGNEYPFEGARGPFEVEDVGYIGEEP